MPTIVERKPHISSRRELSWYLTSTKDWGMQVIRVLTPNILTPSTLKLSDSSQTFEKTVTLEDAQAMRDFWTKVVSEWDGV